ncbi:LacI family DNA-binding transcriptional regulator [Paracoccus sp. Z330]|uniref:LacI family DNA-binding transcriptional regulator n=1 Tax=Paracoccus onchidii TaxID=3017813 RepID=A0ABT4ZAZ2_9RHOB|nr:LacI family DNA-binding transcriptional regulator [Paracoccus onchidii]MDB6176312.1 LacI family DNA-binding transcriptional regulator [Paracoccus onchidii]
MANLQDVAKAAGVSKTTVSRFLNGSLELPDRTVQQIETAIRALNYVPNPHARRLSLGRSDTVALVVPDIATPFFATFVSAVEEAADARGLTLALHATLNRSRREMKYLDFIAHGHADGLIFVTNHASDAAVAAKINAAGRCVVVDEDVVGAEVPKLFCDNLQGGALAGRHLAEAGHRHVLFVGGVEEMISGARRYQGFRRGFEQCAGPQARIDRICGQYTYEAGHAAARRFLQSDPRPTAIFASSDELAIGTLEVLREAGVSVPREVSLIGFDDVGPLHLFAPAITAVRQPVRDLGRRALELVFDSDWKDREKLHSEELLPVRLIARESVAPPIRTT